MQHLRNPRLSSILSFPSFFAVLLVVALGTGCKTSTGGGSGGTASGGSVGQGGNVGSGGITATGGASGGATGVGGAGTGGSGVGGTAAGGSGAGGSATGGSGTGGSASGGSGAGGAGTGGAAGSASGGGGGGAQGGRSGQGGGSAGVPGGGGAGGAAACPYKFCEGFESGTVGGIPTGWTQLKGYGMGSAADYGLATDQAHSGSMSLKSSSMMTGQNRIQWSLSGLGAVATKHWGRIFYKLQSPIVKPTSGVLHITFVALQGTTENRVVDTVEMTNGTHQWIYNVPDDSCCTGSDYNWSFDGSWHCAEWYVDFSAKSYRFFTDGTEVTQIGFTGNANAKMSAWTALGVGEIFYQQPPSTLVMWFDDLAINDSQIGCQ
jgi:hypothetical protein